MIDSMPNSASETGVAAAIIELDALADAVRPAAKDHDPPPAGQLGGRFVFVLVGRIIIRRVGLELGRAGIDRLERRRDAPRLAMPPHVDFGRVPDDGQLAVGKAELLRPAEQGVVNIFERPDRPQLLLHLDQFFEIVQKPGVDGRQFVDFVNREARFHRVAQIPDALIARHGEFRADVIDCPAVRACPTGPCRRSRGRNCPPPARQGPSGTLP